MSEPKDDDDPSRQDQLKIPVKVRATIKKWRGEDTSGEPFETIVSKDEGFDEALEKAKKQEDKDATN